MNTPDMEARDIFNISPVGLTNRATINNRDYIKLRSFCTAKEMETIK